MIRLFPCLARLPKVSMYCSATRSWTAWSPPSDLIAPAIALTPSAVAVATVRMAWPSPSASLICCCLFASDSLMTFCFSPSAWLILESRIPSEFRIAARFSRSARICFSMASRTSRGGLMFLISYRRTFTPQGSEALSSSLTTAKLMADRSSKVLSRSILPTSLLRVVCASWIMAIS